MSILVLTSDTLSSPAAAGQIEYSSPIFTGTPQAEAVSGRGALRGIVATSQFYRLDSALAGANATGTQSVFGVGCTLSASTVYEFSMYFILNKTAGTTSHGVTFSLGGTATYNNLIYGGVYNTTGSAFSSGTTATPSTIDSTSASAITLASSSTSAGRYITMLVNGTLSVNASGTFTPQYTITTSAPGGAYSTLAGSFIRIAPIGASGAATNVGTWA